MLKIFRKIRQNLLFQGKTSRYFKYAIGEIILVVIGILIALQINNWNQHRINRNKELSYLKELKTSLNSDAIQISNILQFNIKKDSIVKNLMRIFDANLTNDERFLIIQTNATSFTSYESFKPKSTTWNNLLSAENVGLIKHKELRTSLIDYYSFDYEGSVQERIKIMNRKVVDENFPLFFTKEYALENLNLETDFPSKTEFNLHLNQVMLSDLFGIRFLINMQNEFLEDTLMKLAKLNKLIDKQIQ